MSSVEGQTGQEVLHNPSAGFFCCFAAPPFAGTINTNNMTGNTIFFFLKVFLRQSVNTCGDPFSEY